MDLLKRTRWILVLLLQGQGARRYNAPVIGRTRLLKELFLLKMTFGFKDIEYDFVPLWYGPFSPDAYADLEFLTQEGLITIEKASGDMFSLTPKGVKAAQGFERLFAKDQLKRIRECKERFNSMPIEELVAYVYERWPKFTERTLRTPSSALAELRKAVRDAGITEGDIDRAIAESRAARQSG